MKELKPAAIKLESFVILESVFILHRNVLDQPMKQGSKYVFSSDFNFYEHKEIQEKHKLEVVVESNDDWRKNNGYEIRVVAGAVFSFDDQFDSDKSVRSNIIKYTALPMIYGLIRGHILSVSSIMPIDRLLFPSFDINKLFVDLADEQIKNSNSKSSQRKKAVKKK